jgi:ribonuclease P protein component
MGKLWKRLTAKEFQSLFERGKFISGRLISIIVDIDAEEKLVGFAVKKSKTKIENVQRNRIKRRLREAFIKIEDLLPDNLAMVLIGKPEAEFTPIDEISAEILNLIKKADL